MVQIQWVSKPMEATQGTLARSGHLGPSHSRGILEEAGQIGREWCAFEQPVRRSLSEAKAYLCRAAPRPGCLTGTGCHSETQPAEARLMVD